MKPKSQVRDILFCLASTSIFILVLVIPIRGTKEFSIQENRYLQQFPIINGENFLSGNFQSELEKFISDQILLSSTSKQIYMNLKNKLNLNFIQNLLAVGMKGSTPFVHINNGVFFNYEENALSYLVQNDMDLTDWKTFVEELNSYYKSMENIKFYTYYVTTSEGFQFNKNRDNVLEFLKDNLKVTGMDYLKIENYNDFIKKFYKTDHHWNKLGSYLGYVDICKMLNIEPIVPKGEIVFNEVNFQGSLARLASFYDIKEPFSIYEFDLSENIEVSINGKNRDYGNYSSYIEGDIPNVEGINHYGNFYGDDFGEIHFKNDTKEGNILLIGTSYDNAIVRLIAESFQNLYSVDLRAYEKDIKRPFHLMSYVKEKNIDTVVYIGDLWSFINHIKF